METDLHASSRALPSSVHDLGNLPGKQASIGIRDVEQVAPSPRGDARGPPDVIEADLAGPDQIDGGTEPSLVCRLNVRRSVLDRRELACEANHPDAMVGE